MTVCVERHGGIVVWRLSRPGAKNALDQGTLATLQAAIAAAAADLDVRAAVLTGDGDIFASGADLRALRGAVTAADAANLADAGRSVCDAITRLHTPVIAALPGPAIGGGAELAVACDLRVADARASLCFKHARMAVTTAWGVMPKLVAMVGHGAACRLLLTAQRIEAGEAHRIGLVDVVCDDGACLTTALALGREVARGAPRAVGQLKGLLRDALGALDEYRARERQCFLSTWTTGDHREAVEAFFEARAPRWTGD